MTEEEEKDKEIVSTSSELNWQPYSPRALAIMAELRAEAKAMSREQILALANKYRASIGRGPLTAEELFNE